MRIERNNYQIGIYLEKALNEKNMSVKQLLLTILMTAIAKHLKPQLN